MTTVEMPVRIDCAGCESKVRKASEKLKVLPQSNTGVDNIEIDMAMQKVSVTGSIDQKKVLKTVGKTGRRAELWQFPYNPDYDNYTNRENFQHSSGVMNHAYASQPSSSYNYYKHGYESGASHGYYYHNRPAHSSIFGRHAGAAFSDENPRGCSVM